MEYMCVCVCTLQYRPYMTLNSEHLLCSFVLYIYVQRETPMFVAQLTASVFIYTVYHWLIALSLVLSFSPTMLYISKSVQANNATSVMVDLLPRVCGQSTCTLSCSIERVLHVVVLLIKEGTHAASQATPTEAVLLFNAGVSCYIIQSLQNCQAGGRNHRLPLKVAT